MSSLASTSGKPEIFSSERSFYVLHRQLRQTQHAPPAVRLIMPYTGTDQAKPRARAVTIPARRPVKVLTGTGQNRIQIAAAHASVLQGRRA